MFLLKIEKNILSACYFFVISLFLFKEHAYLGKRQLCGDFKGIVLGLNCVVGRKKNDNTTVNLMTFTT